MKKAFKRNLMLLCAAALVVSFCIVWQLETEIWGNVRHVERVMASSHEYSEKDVSEAMDAVIAHFRNNFGGCQLLDIQYDEARSQKQNEDWAKYYQVDQAIVLYSTFAVHAESAMKSGLTPGKTYRNWQWILVRNAGGTWQLKTWGYG